MAEALLRDRLASAGVDAQVSSAGDLPGGACASDGAVRAMAARGLDLGAHTSRTLTPDLIDGADVVIAMARRHLQSAVVLCPGVWSKTFTLKELVRRARQLGPRRRGEPFEAWLAAAHEGRTRQQLLGDDRNDDIADPIGGPQRAYDKTAAELEALIDAFVSLAFPPAIEESA